jgi:outer membrane protein TolC
MKMRGSAVAIIGVLLLAPALAQPPQVTPAAAAPRDMHLLDEVPDYAAVLVHQWRAGLPADVTAAERSTEQYGRLLDTQPPQATSLADCIALALQNNTTLQIQQLGPLTARAQVQRARAVFDAVAFGHVTRDRQTSPATSPLTSGSTSSLGPLPTVFNQHFSYDAGLRKMFVSGGQLSLAYSMNRLVANPSLVNLLVPQYTSTLGLSLNQPLLRDFGWRYSLLLVEVAQNTEQATYHQYEASIATLISQVEHAYWTYVLAIEQVQVQEQGLTLANELLRQNQRKFNVGALPQTAVLQAQAEVARREANLLQVRNLRDNARDALRAIVNAKGDAGGLVMIDAKDKPTIEPYQIDLEHSLRTALEQRPELLAARLTIHAQGLQRKIAENQLLPRLDFGGQLGLNGVSGGRPPVTFIPGQPQVQAAQGLEGNYGRALELLVDGRFYNYSAGASIEIPLGNSQA